MKRAMIKCLAFFLVFQLTACGSSKEASNMTGKSQGGQKVAIPKEIENIPDKYATKADKPGTLTDLYYDTYESFSYNEKLKPLKKHAVVYLPYGYSKDKKYDVFYLMHGGWGDETTTFGTSKNPSSFKNIVDNAIAAGEIRPLIIVCPTYNNTNNNGLDSNNFSLAMQLKIITMS